MSAVDKLKELARKWHDEAYASSRLTLKGSAADELESLIPELEAEIAALRESMQEHERLAVAAAFEEAAREADSWGDQCAGGSGGEIIQSGPSKGQRYGEGYYNLAKKIRTLAANRQKVGR